LTFAVRCPADRELVYVDRGMWEKVVLDFVPTAFKFPFKRATAGDPRALVG
jgi:hypothetical protein